MNKNFFRTIAPALLLCAAACCVSCTNEEDEPDIEGVWTNMTSQPAAQVHQAYPGQTLCIKGSGFDDLRKIDVNGTVIDVTNTLIYDTDNSILFKVPADVSTVGDYIKVTTRYGQATYSPFVIRPASQQPKISKFSATTLVAGRTLTITGVNLEGAQEVWLPTPFGGEVKCSFDASQTNSATTVYAVIPDAPQFAKGQCRIVMEKTDADRGTTYQETVYSSVTNFQ